MTAERPAVTVTRRGASGERELRNGRGLMFDVAGPAQGTTLDVHLNELRPGAGDGPFHLHTNAENVYYVLTGQVRIRLGNEVLVAGPGDVVFVPPKVPHGVSLVDERPATLLEIYAPAEPDFIAVEEGGSH